VRAADHVAVEVVAQDLGVTPLGPGGHGHPGVGKQLVPVQAEDLQPPAVEKEAVLAEFGLAEPDPLPHRV
jgi:hypothetical protein